MPNSIWSQSEGIEKAMARLSQQRIKELDEKKSEVMLRAGL